MPYLQLDTPFAGTTNQQISHFEPGERQLTVEWLLSIFASCGSDKARRTQADINSGPQSDINERSRVKQPCEIARPVAASKIRGSS